MVSGSGLNRAWKEKRKEKNQESFRGSTAAAITRFYWYGTPHCSRFTGQTRDSSYLKKTNYTQPSHLVSYIAQAEQEKGNAMAQHQKKTKKKVEKKKYHDPFYNSIKLSSTGGGRGG